MSAKKLAIAKQHDALPDAYGIKLFYIDGKTEELEAAQHRLTNGMLEVCSHEDIWSWVTLSNVKRLEFDKRFSKIIALKNETQHAPK